MSEPQGQRHPGAKHGAGTYQMLWDCKFCGTQKLLGVTHPHCPNCGAAQDPERRYFPAEEDMVALEDHKYVGADKICPACRQPNSAASTYCSECGADLATGQPAPIQQARELGTEAAAGDTRRDVVKDKFDAEMERIGVTQRAQARVLGIPRNTLIVALGALLLVLCIGGAVYALTYRSQAAGEIVDRAWQRTVEVEAFQAVSDTAWDESVPGDAYGVACERRQRDTRQVPDGSHQECRDVDQGDGSMRRECTTVTDYRDEPVYDQWCRYRVDRWVLARTEKINGAGQAVPAWPTLNLASSAGVGAEREGDRHEQYAVTIRDADGKTDECRFDTQAEWDRYPLGARVTLKRYVTGGADCGSLTLAN